MIVGRQIKEDEFIIKDKDNKYIKQVPQHQVLGWTMNKRIDMNQHFENVICLANYKIHKIKSKLKYLPYYPPKKSGN